jgi:hypothetical protein
VSVGFKVLIAGDGYETIVGLVEQVDKRPPREKLVAKIAPTRVHNAAASAIKRRD